MGQRHTFSHAFVSLVEGTSCIVTLRSTSLIAAASCRDSFSGALPARVILRLAIFFKLPHSLSNTIGIFIYLYSTFGMVMVLLSLVLVRSPFIALLVWPYDITKNRLTLLYVLGAILCVLLVASHTCG
jgi:hypothetical protein